MNFFAEEGARDLTGMPPLYADPADEIQDTMWVDWTVLTFIALFALISIVATWRPLRQGECYWHRKFLDSLEEQGTVSGAARAAGMTIEHCHKHREKNPYFRRQWNLAADRYIHGVCNRSL